MRVYLKVLRLGKIGAIDKVVQIRVYLGVLQPKLE